MRLHRLFIKRCRSVPGFKNLSDFEIRFGKESATAVLVGRNGTGKSNVLEALTLIFRDLDLGETNPGFGYELEYSCRGHEIAVDADPDRPRGKIEIQVDGRSVSLRKFAAAPDREFLPNYVFGYYSGPSNRMEEHFLKHQERFYRDLISSEERDELPLRPLFYARHIHSQFVLLAFFLEQDEEALRFLDDVLGISDLDSVLFVMKQPPWNSNEGDERFWRARGAVRRLLGRLYEHALAPLRCKWSVPLGFRKSTKLEHLYLYLSEAADLRKLRDEYDTQQDFFKALESTYISELIREVRTRVRARGLDAPLTFRELSEGEQQLLMVLGLLRFTQEEESLFLLDEPDTHLNPAWSVQYLDLLTRIGGLGENGHVIMATHDPLVISGLTREQVRLFDRGPTLGQITASPPEQDPKGLGVAGLLASDLYGLRSDLDADTLELLDQKVALSGKSEMTDLEKAKLQEVDTRLSHLGFLTAFSDPYYAAFVKAWGRRHSAPMVARTDLTPEERKAEERLADEILDEIEKEGLL